MSRTDPSRTERPWEPPLRVTLGTGLEGLSTEPQQIVLMLDTQDLKNGNLQRCVDDLLYLSDSAQRTEQFAGSLFFAFHGLDADARQAHAVGECRDMLQTLYRQWPYWMHFLAPEPDLWTVWLLCQLPQSPAVRLSNGRTGRELDPKALRNLMLELSYAMIDLHDHHKLADSLRKRIVKSSARALELATGSSP